MDSKRWSSTVFPGERPYEVHHFPHTVLRERDTRPHLRADGLGRRRLPFYDVGSQR